MELTARAARLGGPFSSISALQTPGKHNTWTSNRSQRPCQSWRRSLDWTCRVGDTLAIMDRTLLGAGARATLAQADQLARIGNVSEAARLCRQVADTHPRAIEPRVFLASLESRSGRFEAAAQALRECLEFEPDDPDLNLRLATVLEKADRRKEALDVYLNAFRRRPNDPRLALFAGAALEDAGRTEEAAIVFSLGDDIDPQMRKLHLYAGATPEIREMSLQADRRMREHYTALHDRSVDEAARLLSAEVLELDRVRAAIWPQTHAQAFDYLTPLQAPDIFYMPGLPATPTVSRERLTWASELEACTDVVRAEYQRAVAAGALMQPYVHAGTESPIWTELRGNTDWSSLHLYARAEETPAVRFFPRTLRALGAADVVRVGKGNPIEMFFSRLAPGTHIPPHFGAANNRLTVHLPLIVPSDCAIRIGEEVHGWREGELLAFDDSFEHEAWNRSDTERVVLIFEAHHPNLAPVERKAIEYVFEARERWRRERRPP